MANIVDIYKQFKIMPQLQLHQFRVAAVAKQICDNFNHQIDEQSVVAACLLHDMGNIIKFDLTVFPDFTEPEGLDYWQSIKEEYLKKYKTQDEHPATLAIAGEIGVSDRVIELIGSVGFTHGPANAASEDYGRKICAYSDMRVGPHGVLSLEDRLIDGALRYTGQKFKPGERQDEFAIALRKIESQLFLNAAIKPQDISDKSIEPIIESLKSYEINT